MPEWESVKARREVKRVNAEIKSLRSSIKHAESEIQSIQISLEELSESDRAVTTMSNSPSHAVLWRRNQLFRQKIQLETQRDKLKMRLQIAETQIRQLEAHDAMAQTIVRGRKAMIEDDQDENISGSSSSKRMNADEKLQRFRRADREHRLKLKRQEHEQRKEEMKKEIQERKKESKDAIRRALKYKEYLKTKKKKKDEWKEHAVRAADVARAAANHVRSLVIRVETLVEELRIRKDQENIKGIVILRRDDVMIPIEETESIACRVMIYDDCDDKDEIQSTKESDGVMTLSLPKSSGMTVAVIPDMKSEKNRTSWISRRGRALYTNRVVMNGDISSGCSSRSEKAERLLQRVRFCVNGEGIMELAVV